MYFLSINRIRPDADRKKLGEIIPLHIEWTMKKISEGIILLAGKWGESGGMALLEAVGPAEAEKILQEDPLVRSGLVAVETGRFFPEAAIG